jgi:hypothetical protein
MSVQARWRHENRSRKGVRHQFLYSFADGAAIGIVERYGYPWTPISFVIDPIEGRYIGHPRQEFEMCGKILLRDKKCVLAGRPVALRNDPMVGEN